MPITQVKIINPRYAFEEHTGFWAQVSTKPPPLHGDRSSRAWSAFSMPARPESRQFFQMVKLDRPLP
jgi:hypothetical protein